MAPNVADAEEKKREIRHIVLGPVTINILYGVATTGMLAIVVAEADFAGTSPDDPRREIFRGVVWTAFYAALIGHVMAVRGIARRLARHALLTIMFLLAFSLISTAALLSATIGASRVPAVLSLCLAAAGMGGSVALALVHWARAATDSSRLSSSPSTTA